ncbi:hypothetical protein [Alicyclobacillus mengziensis]|uniref:Uncharacterized protein n=1 Tax=Alicyclobacillus mengziensis TaxID=2931921 RepID=A0A9X7Z7L3_9BACL|nr:hypothetical protein [Alicyclobacillus mengziensis]QSO47480.1 hypothetical protein JZ786_24385 [Alicyclobacillus mengziensis]
MGKRKVVFHVSEDDRATMKSPIPHEVTTAIELVGGKEVGLIAFHHAVDQLENIYPGVDWSFQCSPSVAPNEIVAYLLPIRVL